MAETHLALLSPDNVLRLVKSNGNGTDEVAAIALGHEYSVNELMMLVGTLVDMTTKPEVKAKVKAKAKALPAASKEKKDRAPRRPNHKWLSSAWLIRFVDVNPDMRASQLGKAVCEALGKTYTTANQGDGGVVSSRLSNLVAQKKLSRDANGQFYSTPEGLAWADEKEPEHATTPG